MGHRWYVRQRRLYPKEVSSYLLDRVVGCLVTPSPRACRLNHTAALLGQGIVDAAEFGWLVPPGVTHDWKALASSVQSYIKGINFGYRTALRAERVEYINAAGASLSFLVAHRGLK